MLSPRLYIYNTIHYFIGKIVDKFFEHTNEITAIDFDGSNVCSGGADGLINYYYADAKGSRQTSRSMQY
jgi:hypothetical protein